MTMTRDRLLADLSRAVAECFPDRAEEIMREVERRMPATADVGVPGGRLTIVRAHGMEKAYHLDAVYQIVQWCLVEGLPMPHSLKVYPATFDQMTTGLVATISDAPPSLTQSTLVEPNSPRPPDNSEGR